MKTREVTESLRDHLCAHGFFAATEVPLVTRGAFSGEQRADVLAIKLHEFAKKDVRIYEVKVSRADFLKDLEASKAESYGAFAKRVYYACPSGLIKKHEVPATVGLMTLSAANGWRTLKAATPGTAARLTVDLMLLMMARGYHDERRVRRLEDRVSVEGNLAIQHQAKTLGWRIAARLAEGNRADPRGARAEQLLTAVEGVLARPNPDTAINEKQAFNRSLSGQTWDENFDSYLRTALHLVDDAKRMQTVSEYIGLVASRYGAWHLAEDDKTLRKLDRAVSARNNAA